MPCSCFGKKDKKAGVGDKYSREAEKEPLTASSQAPAQTEAVPATPPTPVTPTSDDPRLRPEDDPDKASRRRDVVASFYSDQCELIGFKATGSRPPSAVAGGGNGATSPTGSAPSSSRASALSRADLAIKRREFFKDLAVNDLNSSRYGSSEPSWRLVDSGSLTTPRRPYHQDGSRTLPPQARFGGIVLRPVSSPAKATSGPDLRINGNPEDSHDHLTHDGKVPEGEPVLDVVPPEVTVAHHQEVSVKEPLLAQHHKSEEDQSTPPAPSTPPVTPATPPPTPPATTEPLTLEISSLDQPHASEALIELAATHLEGRVVTEEGGEVQQLVVQQQYVQQVSVTSDDERLVEGSSILIKEAFPEESRSHSDTPAHDLPDTTNASGTPSTPSVIYEAATDVSQHSSEQPTTPTHSDTDIPTQRRSSHSEDEEEDKRSSQHSEQVQQNTGRDLKRSSSSSSSEASPPGSPKESRHTHVEEKVVTVVSSEQQQVDDECGDSGEAEDSSGITDCIPNSAPTQEGEACSSPSPPNTPPIIHQSPPPAGEKETCPPASPTQPTIHDPTPPSPPTQHTLSEPLVSCGVDVSSSQLEDDGLGSDIDDALSSLECLTEEGNNEKRATAST